jgi:hypothetical protein
MRRSDIGANPGSLRSLTFPARQPLKASRERQRPEDFYSSIACSIDASAPGHNAATNQTAVIAKASHL